MILSLEEFIGFVNDYVLEYLEVLVNEFLSILGEIKNVGEILLGNYIFIFMVNYCLGVNVILLIGGFVRFYFVVFVFDFLKCFGIGYFIKEGFESLKNIVYILVDYEGFLVYVMVIKEWDILFKLN